MIVLNTHQDCDLSADDIADNWCPQCGEYIDLKLAEKTEPRFRGEIWIDGHIQAKLPS